jgi:hypothetical protein
LLRIRGEGFGEVDEVVLCGAIPWSVQPSYAACATSNLPFRVEAYDFDLECALLSCLPISYFQSSNPGNQARLKREVVFGLWFRVDVFNYDIDRLSGVGLIQIGITDQIGILKHLWRRKTTR